MEEPGGEGDHGRELAEARPPVPRDKLPPNASRELRMPQIYDEEDVTHHSSGMSSKSIVALAVISSLVFIGFGWIMTYHGELRVAEAENDCLGSSYGCDARDRANRLNGLLLYNWGKGIVMIGTLMLASIFTWMGLFFDRFPSNLRLSLIIMAVILIVSLPLLSLASPSFSPDHIFND